MIAVVGDTLVTHNRELSGADALVLERGRILWVGSRADMPYSGLKTLAADNLLIAPGYIDLQLNGGFGHDFTDTPMSIWMVAEHLPAYGVTAFLPTIITSPPDIIRNALDALRHPPPDASGAVPLGLHLEGPFLNPLKKGAHNPAHLRTPDLDAIASWQVESGVRLVTLAPELAGAHALIEQLAVRGVVVSAGHSMATLAEADAAVARGVRYGTHLFNAMPSVHHREPGLAGALLADDRVICGLIPDGVHVHPALVKSVHRAAKHRVSVVTDSMAAMGMPPGSYVLAGRTVTVENGCSRLDDGTLAGSIVTLDQAVRNYRQWTGCSVTDAIATVTVVPAQLLNLPDRGALEVGARGDLILLTPDLDVHTTIINGRVEYSRNRAWMDPDYV